MRKQISKRVRFEIFKRDIFTCQYCGATPPKVILHIDHITAVSAGGGNESDNLVTSCLACNLGKGARSLLAIPQSLRDKATEISEREEQLRGYQEVLEAKRQRLEDESWRVADIILSRFGEQSIRRDYLQSIKRFVDRLGVHDVLDSMDSAVNKKYSTNSAFRYFCGICWRKIRGE